MTSVLQHDTLFRCASCRARLEPSMSSYLCASGHRFEVRDGVVDLVPIDADGPDWETWRRHLAAFERRRQLRRARPRRPTSLMSQRGGDLASAFIPFMDLAGDRLLDVGCGPGGLRRHLPATVRYVGIDPLPIVPDVHEFEFARAVSEHLPLEDGAVTDVVICHALDHIGNVPWALDEFARVLEPGGRLHVLQIVLDRQDVLRRIAHETKDWLEDRSDALKDDDVPHHMSEFSTGTLRATLEQRFRITRLQHWAATPITPRRAMVTAEPALVPTGRPHARVATG